MSDKAARLTWSGSRNSGTVCFGIRTINPGGFSSIHVLSAFTLIQTPLIAWFAHKHYVRAHRTAVQAMVLSALLIAGFFTFPFGRMLGRWRFGCSGPGQDKFHKSAYWGSASDSPRFNALRRTEHLDSGGV